MFRTINPDEEIVIHFQFYDDLPNSNYVAWIEGGKYKGIVVSADSIADCVKEVGISLKVLDLYRKNIKTKDNKYEQI